MSTSPEDAGLARRGLLRVYLGVASGSGKTFALLDEGRRRQARGTDVVVGLVDAHGRAPLTELAAGLEELPALVHETSWGPVRGLDTEAVLARHPQVVLVDDLARRDPPDAGQPPRWQSVERLLAAGIDVVTTVDIDQLESLADVVESVTGRPQSARVPDEVVRRADQIELVDMAPEALRRRLAHGNIHPPERIDAALSQYYRVGNLAALRELALLWLADRVDEGLERYRREHDIGATWPARERVLVALTGGPESDVLLRRGARIAARGAGGELHVVHVAAPTGRGPDVAGLARLRGLTEELGGTYHSVVSGDPAEAVLHLARGLNASQVLLGASRHRAWWRPGRAGVGERVIAGSGDIDVLVVTHPFARAGEPRRRAERAGPDPVRRGVGWLLAGPGALAVAATLASYDDDEALALASMALLALTVVCALVGGRWPAIASAVTGSLALNWFFTPPFHTLTIADPVNVVSLVLFVLVGAAVASVVDVAARRSVQAGLARHEADSLTLLNRTMLAGPVGTDALLDLLRERFDVEAVALLERRPEGWQTIASAGSAPPSAPGAATDTTPLSPDLVLATRAVASLPAHEATILAAFATHLAVALQRQRLEQQAAEAQQLREGNRVRTALLAAVSHDLRTPLAGIKAAVSSLRSPDVRWSEEEQAELLGTVEDLSDRLHQIIANLLDLSRLQTGSVQLATQEVGVDDVVSHTVANLPGAGGVELRFADDLPLVRADAGLLDRVVENLLDNALRHADGRPVTVRTGHAGGHVQVHVVDRGPGVPDSQKELVFQPFRRLGDRAARQGAGVGLGLAVARGLTEAMGGRLLAEDTPGGGLTMVVELPSVATSAGAP